MLIIKEATTRQKELLQTITPLVQQYAKATASQKVIFDMTVRLAEVLEDWEYSPKEVKDLDKRAFSDLIRSWQKEASAKDLALIKMVF